MRISDELIEEIRQRSDIVEVIGESVKLKPQGKSYVGLCPFHADKKPSMNVNPQLGIFKCFSCGKGGNVITFLMDFHKMSFIEALRLLASRNGIVLPDEEHEEDKEKKDRSDAIYTALHEAQKYYRGLLAQQDARSARSYISKRGFSEEIVDLFGLGYAPDTWRKMLEEMVRRGFSEQTLEDAGLIIRRDDNTVYDRFRGRLMFPVTDHSGKIVGFGARLLSDEQGQPKYINSPDTQVYNKSRILYGLSIAKNSIRNQDSAILTEGYADTISLHQFGFTNTIATSGTAITKEQLHLLSRYCKKVHIIYDGDSAGQKATIRAIDLSIEQGLDVKVVTLPIDEDPDTFVRSRGADALRAALLSAPSFLDYRIDVLKREGVFENSSSMADGIRQLIELITRVPDVMQHDFLLQRLWDKLRLSELQLRRIYDEYNKKIGERKSAATEVKYISRIESSSDNNVKREESDPAARVEKVVGAKDQLYPEEKELIRLGVINPKALRFMVVSLDVKSETMVSRLGKYFFERAVEALEEDSKNVYNVIVSHNTMNDEYKSMLDELVLKRESPSERWKDFEIEIPAENQRKIMTDCLMRLRMRAIEHEAETMKQNMTDITDEEQLELMKKIKGLAKEKNDLILKLKSFV